MTFKNFYRHFMMLKKKEAKASEVQVAIDEFCSSLDLETKGYEVPLCRNQVNAVLADSDNFCFPGL